MKRNIYYHDTDCGGVVYYANYLKYIEEARTEFFRQKGISIKELALEGTLFVVARQEVDYKSPAFYGDTLEIETRFSQIRAAKMIAEHKIKNQEGVLVCSAKTVMVCVDKDIRPKAIPEALVNKLKEAGT
jgi:acyl-CoA thioester hydrolase